MIIICNGILVEPFSLRVALLHTCVFINETVRNVFERETNAKAKANENNF